MKNKKTKLTELVFILDRSGSMCGLEADTIGGFNSMLKRQKAVAGEAIVTTVLFDDRYELLHDRLPIACVAEMTQKQYYVRGCTALMDAIGRTIVKIANVQKSVTKEHRADQVIFVITTDGFENASREYSVKQIRTMIEKQKKMYGWEFIFLGANMDAVKEGAKLGITEDRAVTYCNDHEGVALNYEAITDALTAMRSTSAPVGREWKEKIERRHA